MIFFIIIIFILAIFIALSLTKGAFSPARLFALMWSTLIVGYFCFSNKPFVGTGLIWIAFAIIILALGEFIGVRYAKQVYGATAHTIKLGAIESGSKKTNNKDFKNHNIKNLYIFLLIAILIAVVGKIIFLYSNGYSILTLFNIKSFLEMNTEIANDRYNGDASSNYFLTALSCFSYVAPLCGGYLLTYCGKSKKRILLCILSLFPILLTMAIENTKSGVIDSVILFAVGFMISFMRVNKRLPKIKSKHVIIFICAIAVLFALLFAVMCVRLGGISAENIAAAKAKFIEYAFGNVEAFDVWFSQYYKFGSYDLGVNTFMAPFDLLGIVSRKQGVYDFLPGVSSNIFSAFRGVISDFGIIGGLIFMFGVGYVGGISYVKLRRQSCVLSQFLYAAIVFFLIRSYLGSPWVYTSFWVVFLAFLLFILYASNRKPKKLVIKMRKQIS